MIARLEDIARCNADEDCSDVLDLKHRDGSRRREDSSARSLVANLERFADLIAVSPMSSAPSDL